MVALTLNYKLVTSNEKHFRDIPGLAIENWSRA
jgi:predicted nucleic acid-binding protein